jgi:predicted Ser/Thr protein kinase
MNYLEQLRLEAAVRSYRSALEDAQKAAMSRMAELVSAHGPEYLEALAKFNRQYVEQSAYAESPEGSHFRGIEASWRRLLEQTSSGRERTGPQL